MMKATTRRCPAPEPIRNREDLAGSSWEAGGSSVAGITTQGCPLLDHHHHHNSHHRNDNPVES